MSNLTRRQLLIQTRNAAIVSAALASCPAAALAQQNNPSPESNFGYGEGEYGQKAYPAQVDVVEPAHKLLLPIVTKE